MITFITEDEKINKKLTELGVVKYPEVNPREHLYARLSTQKNLCRDSDRYDFIMRDLMDSTNTAIFIDSGTEIIGLVNFNIYEENTMVIESICTPYSKGTGTQLIDVLKLLGMSLHLKELAVISLPSAKRFYEKNGLIVKDGYLLGYTFANRAKSKSTSMSKSKSKSKKTRKSRIRARKTEKH
jgi:hypothetical protein